MGIQYKSPVVAASYGRQAPAQPAHLGSSLSNLRWLHCMYDEPQPQPSPVHQEAVVETEHVYVSQSGAPSVDSLCDTSCIVPDILHQQVNSPIVPTNPSTAATATATTTTANAALYAFELGDRVVTAKATAWGANAQIGGARKRNTPAADFLAATPVPVRHSQPKPQPPHHEPQHQPGTKEFYAADATCRPPYSYPAIVYMSMKATGKARVQLAEIYGNIMDQWSYYKARPNESGWKNSIRHNLTVSKCFHKVSRLDGDTGKGGYWGINEKAAKADVDLQPRTNMIKAAQRKPKKKASKGVHARGSKPLGGTPTKSMAKTKKPTKPTQITTVEAVEAPVHLESMLDDELVEYPLLDGMDINAADMANAVFGGMDHIPHTDHHSVVPDSCSVTIHETSSECSENDDPMLTHSMLDEGPLLGKSFSSFMDCTKGLGASQSFTALPTETL